MSIGILLGLVVMWAVVLVPMWLRRHDELEESRSVDRFTTAMHTLSRREAPADKRYVVMPHRSRSLEIHVSGASADARRVRRRLPAAVRRALAARSARAAGRVVTPAARRRRTLIGLLVATVLTFVLAVVIGGVAVWALQIVVDACLAAFVAQLRNRARRASAVRPVRRPIVPVVPVVPAVAPRPAPWAAPEFADVERFEPVAVSVAAAAGPPESLFDQIAVADVDDTAHVAHRLDDAALDDPTFEAERVAAYQPAAPDPVADMPASDPLAEPEIGVDGEIGARPWEPVPVPRPAYATKPTAPARTRRAPIAEPMPPPVDNPAERDPADDLEEILDRRWAVND